jgi:hypothetical protein
VTAHDTPEFPGTSSQAGLLELIARRGGMTLAGNKENFAVLRFIDGKWLIEEGDTMTGDSETWEIDAALAYRRVRERCAYMFELFGPDGAGKPTDEDILAFMKDWPTSV